MILNSFCSMRCKIYFNGRCVYVNPNGGGATAFALADLDIGRNVILIACYSPNEWDSFSLQIKHYAYEMADHEDALSKAISFVHFDNLQQICGSPLISDESVFRFTYFCPDPAKYRNEYRVEVHDSQYGLQQTLECNLYEVAEIDTAKLLALDPDRFRHIWVGVTMIKANGEEEHLSFFLYLYHADGKVKALLKQAEPFLHRIDSVVDDEIQARCQKIYQYTKNGNQVLLYWQLCLLRDLVTNLKNGKYPTKPYLTDPGAHEFWIHSELDDSYIRMAVRIPKNYDPEIDYPIVLVVSTPNEGWWSWYPIEDVGEEPCLVFDVTGRGFSGGSYVGEASIFEVLGWIKRHYRIDEDRLYIFGQSNGGYATYSIAQNHPDLPAAISPQISNPNMGQLENIAHLPIYQLVSPTDYIFANDPNRVKRHLGKYGKYRQINFKNMLHEHFGYFIYHKTILHDMFEKRRNRFPDTVRFTTCRNRHLKSHWIVIHGIQSGKRQASIHADIVSRHEIVITIKNASGLTITIPPQIDRAIFSITINHVRFEFQNDSNKTISFLCVGKTWRLGTPSSIPDVRKGTGLLDVYLGSMRIVVPQDADLRLRTVAEQFAHPHTNGMDPVLYTNYPIYEDNATPDHLFAHNLILLDYHHTNRLVKDLANRLPISYQENGYDYKGIHYEGKYVILQVLPNPYNPSLSVMVIGTNDLDMFRKCFFTRRVIIPYYANGTHPYWNNEVLIYSQNQYKAVYEHDEVIRSVETPSRVIPK